MTSGKLAAGLFSKAIGFFAKRGGHVAAEGAKPAGRFARLFSAGRRDVERDARVMTRDPIDVASGEVVLHRCDVALSGVLPLVLERTHVSTYQLGGLFGTSWASTLDQHLRVTDNGVSYAADDGMVLEYPRAAPGVPVLSPSGPRRPLTNEADGAYTVEDPRAGRIMRFGRQGVRRRLEAIGDRNGNRIELDYDASGALTEVRHAGGYRLGAEVRDGRLVALRLLSGDSPDRPLVRYTYDESGNLAEAYDSSDVAQRFTYDHAARLTGWRDRNGHWYRYAYDELGRGIRGEGDDGVLDTTLRYDPAGRWTEVTDSLGQTTTYHFNDHGRVVTEVDPAGHRTAFEWDAHDRMLARTDPLGGTTRFAYDEAGNLITLTRPDGEASHATYDPLGLPTRVVEADGAVWRNERDERGNLTAVTDPLGGVTRYGHDEHGAVTSILDPLGNATTIATSDAGLPLRVTDPGGGVLRYAYDAYGQVTAITDPIGGTARLTWSPEGLPTSRTLPSGAAERWEYDAERNLIAHTDASGRTSRTEYGAFATPVAHTGPDGARLRFGHDTELRVTEVVDQRGLTWRYHYDAAGRLVTETDFNGRTIGYRHDAAGRLTARTDADATTTTLVRDPLGNVVRKQTADGTTTYEYDLAGRMVRAVNPAADLRLERDALGRVTAETRDGLTLTATFDAAGRPVERRTPGGAVSTWRYDSAGRPAELAGAGRRLTFEYDAAGREVRRRFGANSTVQQRWNADHRLISQELWQGPQPALVQLRNYAHGPAGELNAVWDQIAGSRRFELDRAGRVTGVQAQGWTERYAYNDAGDIVDAAAPAAPDSTGEREYQGTRLRRAGRTWYEYDARGRTVLRRQRTLSGQDRSWRYEWDAEDHLVGVVTPDGREWRYGYDALGRRITKRRVDGAVTVDFVWDGDRLAEETYRSPSGEVRVTSWDYRPGGHEPVAQRLGHEFHAIVTDLVGTPTELVTETGDLAWRRESTLFGDRLGGEPYCPLGFPGQYLDAETGLAYNRNRYYEPDTARYISADPIGLAGGPRPYGYVRNPLLHLDPLGLSQQLPPGMVRIFRNTDRQVENQIHSETGYIMSDAAQGGYRRQGTLGAAFSRSQHVHEVNVHGLGDETNYAWAHQGGATGMLPTGERSFISFTTDEAAARRWSAQFGTPLYSAVVHPSEVSWATHTANETEVLVRNMIYAERLR